MDLKSGRPFWPMRDGLPASFPRLSEALDIEVAVIGAGITGALTAHRLAQDGHDVVVLDGRDAGFGSTSASTALIQYEIDTHLTELIRRYGEKAAVAAYRSGLRAIDELERLGPEILEAGKWRRLPSLYVASSEADLPKLQSELQCLQKNDFPAEFWDRSKLEREFEFTAPGAILSTVAGQLDPYATTYALLSAPGLKGRVFDRTKVAGIDWGDQIVRLTLDSGVVVKCRKVVIACGYESLSLLPPQPISLHSTFAVATETLQEFPRWHERCLIWETRRPYDYIRTTDDDRIIAGGGDCPFDDEATRDALLLEKTQDIAGRLQERFPSLKTRVDFAWAGTFAETFDGLPFIGRHPERPGGFFLLCYGGSGITYSVVGAEMAAAELRGEKHPLTEVFGFSRFKPEALLQNHS